MSLEDKLKNDFNFRYKLSNFLHQFNENINWMEEIMEFVESNKNEKKILDKIKSYIWIDNELLTNDDIVKNKYEKIKIITKSLINVKNELIILTPIYKKTKNSPSIEYEFLEYTEIIKNFCEFRNIKYSFSTIKELKTKKYFDFGWIFLNDEDMKKNFNNKKRLNFPFLGIEKNENIENVLLFKKIYFYINSQDNVQCSL